MVIYLNNNQYIKKIIKIQLELKLNINVIDAINNIKLINKLYIKIKDVRLSFVKNVYNNKKYMILMYLINKYLYQVQNVNMENI